MRAFATLLLAFGLAHAAYGDPARLELPIRQTVLPDGELRYSIPIKLGTTQIDAMLDTGSTGIRVLPDTLKASDFSPSDTTDRYSYGSGAQYDGVTAEATLSLGGTLSGKASFQDIQKVECVDLQPHCPVSRMPASDYGIGGSGFPKQGFRAIFGTLFRTAEVDNPLMALGITRWIVILPRPGDTAPGMLILNPTDAETAGYMMFKLPQPQIGSAVPGCLLNEASKAQICGRVLFDTGANGLLVESHGAIDGFPWAPGSLATIVLEDDRGHQGGFRFATGAEPYIRLANNPHSALPFARISGAVPYFAVSVLYDADTGEVGIKPR